MHSKRCEDSNSNRCKCKCIGKLHGKNVKQEDKQKIELLTYT